MRNKKAAAYLCMILLLLITAGCGNSHADSAVNDETVTNTEENDRNYQSDPEDSDQQSDSTQPQPDSEPLQTDNEPLQSDSELEGTIKSIGDNSVVINQIITSSENEAVSFVGSGEKSITVYFSEETEFEIRTVKNGGVNGDADIEKQQGTFSDLKLDAILNMTGSYD